MEWLHALIAVLAAFRLTTLFTVDALWNPIRKRFPKVPWACSLCMSVWAGAVATICFATVPWLNWPLAISWAWLAYQEGKKPMTKAAKPQEPASAVPATPAAPPAMPKPSELDISMGAMSRERAEHLMAISERAGMLASELAVMKARLEAANKRIEQLEAELKQLRNVA